MGRTGPAAETEAAGAAASTAQLPVDAPDALDAVRALRREFVGLQVIALERSESSVSLAEADIHDPCCLVVGNEVAGVGGPVLAEADLHAHLPMRGVKHSLNVAVAFGVAAYLIADRLDKP